MPLERSRLTPGGRTLATPHNDLLQVLAERPHEIVVIAGAGVSRAASANAACADWKGLLLDGVQFCQDQCNTPVGQADRYRALLNDRQSTDIDYVSVATFVDETLKRQHSGLYGRWLGESVGLLRVVRQDVIATLDGWRVRLPMR